MDYRSFFRVHIYNENFHEIHLYPRWRFYYVAILVMLHQNQSVLSVPYQVSTLSDFKKNKKSFNILPIAQNQATRMKEILVPSVADGFPEITEGSINIKPAEI